MARISSDSNCSEAARQNVTFISLLPSNSRINVFKKSSQFIIVLGILQLLSYPANLYRCCLL